MLAKGLPIEETPKLQVVLPEHTQEQIYQLFVSLAREATKEVIETSTKKYVTQNELRKLFKCSTQVIKEWIDLGLPYFKKGNSIMFILDEVDQFIKSNLMQ